MKEVYCRAIFNYKNVPDLLKSEMKKEYLNNRNDVVKVFNELINNANETFDSKYGDISATKEDGCTLISEYYNLLKTIIEPSFSKFNTPLCIFYIDEFGDIVGRLPWDKQSKIWVDLMPVEEI